MMFLLLLVFVEVMKVLRAKKYAKTKKQQVESLLETSAPQKQSSSCEAEDKEDMNQVCFIFLGIFFLFLKQGQILRA